MNQEFPSRYGQRKREEERKRFWSRLRLAIAIMALTWLILIVAILAIEVNNTAKEIKAVCPEIEEINRECGRIKKLTDYEKYSPEWWNIYCNGVLGTKDECK